jgi:methionine-rich copper-binding protein CopC
MRIRTPVPAALILAIGLALIPVDALAHSRPKVMVPAPDSTVPSPPVISVSFTEPLEPKFSSLTLTDEQGTKLNTASSSAVPNDPKTLTLKLPKLKPGDYLVHWVSVAPDGHRMEGEYKFTVKQ